MTIPVVDAHNDLLLELDHRRNEPTPFTTTWVENLDRGGVVLQVCPVYAAQPEWLPELALRHALQQIAAFARALQEPMARAFKVSSKDDLTEVGRSGRIGLMLSMEGVEPLGYDPELIVLFWELGVRMVSLTWNRRNPFADGLAEPDAGGLSRIGMRLVERAVALGMILDLAHASERTFTEVIDRAEPGTVIVSHAACRAVYETPRNLSDRQLRALAERGGVLGMMMLPAVIDANRRVIDRVVDHVDHAVEIMGIEHVGLGGDFIAQVAESLGWDPPADSLSPDNLSFRETVEGLRGPDGYPMLFEALSNRGYDDAQLTAIASQNMLRLFERALPA